MWNRIFVMLIIVAATTSSGLFAAQPMKIMYHHATGIAETQTLGGREIESQPLTDGQPLEIRGSKKVAVWIADPNPVLYTYKWKDPTYSPNPDYAAALGFAKAVQPIEGLFGKAGVGPEAGPSGGAESPFNKAVTQLKELLKALPEIARITLTDPSEAKKKVMNWPLGEIELTIDQFYEKIHKGDFSEFQPGATNEQEVMPGGFKDPSTAGNNKQAGDGAQASIPTTTKPDSDSGKTSISNAGEPKTQPTDNAFTRRVLQAVSQEQSIRTMLATARGFVQDVEAVGVPKFMGDLTYDATKNATANIFITPVPEFQSVSKDSNRAIGEVTISTRPYWPVHLSFLRHLSIASSRFQSTALRNSPTASTRSWKRRLSIEGRMCRRCSRSRRGDGTSQHLVVGSRLVSAP